VAPTGVAAAVAAGVTLHAFLRLPAGCFDESLLEEEAAERIYSTMAKSMKNRLADTSLLMMDQVSMVSSRMFTLFCYFIGKVHADHNPGRPWRMVAFGDFHQLPPLRRGEEDKNDTRGLYAFRSVHWTRLLADQDLELRYVWRQEDKQFIEMLPRLRVRDVTDELVLFLQESADTYRAQVTASGLTNLEATHIFPHRERVKMHNGQCL